jgi:hypothetical protein
MKRLGTSKPIIGLGLGLSGVAPWNPLKPLAGESVNFWVKGRNGLTMPDGVGGNDVTITTPTYRGYGSSSIMGDKTSSLEKVFDGNSYTIYFKLKQIELSSGVQRVMCFGNDGGAQRGILFYTIGDELYLHQSDGTVHGETKVIASLENILIPAGWVDVICTIYMITNRLTSHIYKVSDGAEIGTASNVDISTYIFNIDDNYLDYRVLGINWGFCDLKKFTGIKTLAQCKDNDYVTDLQLYYPTLLDGIDVSGSGHHLTRNSINFNNWYYSNISTYCLDKGHSVYYRSEDKTSYPDISVPYGVDGSPLDSTAVISHLTGYLHESDHVGSLTRHNLADSMLNISTAQWDKASTTIFENAVRSYTFYNVANSYNWYISELNYLLFSQRCKSSHKGLNFFKITDGSLTSRKYLDDIFSFASNKIGSDIDKIIKYTGDDKQLNDSIILYCDANVLANISFNLKVTDGNEKSKVYWGDGTLIKSISIGTTETTLSKNYSGTENYLICITNPERVNIFKYTLGGTSSTEASSCSITPKGALINEFHKAINIEKLWWSGNLIPIGGTIIGLNTGLKELYLYDAAGVIGGVNLFTSLTKFVIEASLTGDLSGAINLVNIAIFNWGSGADPDMLIDITNMTNIESIDCQFVTNKLRLQGSLTNKAAFKQLCYGLPLWSNLTGDLSTCTLLEYVEHSSNLSKFTGDISGLTNLWNFKDNSKSELTINITNLTNLEDFVISNALDNVTKPTRLNLLTRMSYFNSGHYFTSAEVNQLLADIRTNKDIARLHSGYRIIDLSTGGSQTPTGQGVDDKAYLQSYRSPNNNGAYPLWEIDTAVNTQPINLTLSLISGGVKGDWTDGSGGVCQTEVYGSDDGVNFTLIDTLNAGVTTKSETKSPVDLRYWKARSKNGAVYSAYTPIKSIAMLSAEMMPSLATWAASGLAWWNGAKDANWSGDNSKIISNASGFLARGGFWNTTKTYKTSITQVGTGYLSSPYGGGSLPGYNLNSGTFIRNYTPDSTALWLYSYSSPAFDGNVTAISIKEILMP